jgi:hypothetical protein
VIIASKSSQVLHEGLANFAKKFVRKFENQLDTNDKPSIVQEASALVKECFPFIPQFD